MFRGCFLGVYASLKSRNVSAKPRSCCQILPDHVHVMSDFGSSTLTEAQGEVSKHYSSSRTKCGGLKPQSTSSCSHSCHNVAGVTRRHKSSAFFYVRFSRTIWGGIVQWNGFFSVRALYFALVLIRVSKLACSVKFHQFYVSLSLRAQVAINGLHPRRTALSGGLHVTTHCSCCWRGLCQWWLGFRQFSARRRWHHLVPRDAICLCLTHAYLGSSGGKGGSMMAFVEDKFIIKASWSNCACFACSNLVTPMIWIEIKLFIFHCISVLSLGVEALNSPTWISL